MIELIPHTTKINPVPDMALVRYVTEGRPDQLQLPVLAHELNWGSNKFYVGGKEQEPTYGKITRYVVVPQSNLPTRIEAEKAPRTHAKPLSEEAQKTIRNMRKDGATWDEIVSYTGSNKSTVRNYFLKNKERFGG
jgi:hypothetical protein